LLQDSAQNIVRGREFRVELQGLPAFRLGLGSLFVVEQRPR